MMGRADYFHRDGNAEARRSSLMNREVRGANS